MSTLRWIAASSALMFTLFAARPSRAGVARAVALADIVRASDLVAIGTPLDSYCLWETIGNRRRIVTYTRVHVDERVGPASNESEVLIKTLGGRVGKIGQIVYGEPMLVIGQPALLFAKHWPDGTATVTGRTQGYFPVVSDAQGQRRLTPLTGSHLVGNVARSALTELAGKTPADAVRLVRAVMHP